MTITAAKVARETRWLANAGLAIMAAAFAWWFLFYAQWTGPLHLLDLKVPCLVTAVEACSFFQSRHPEFHAAVPAYHVAAWWIGMALFVAGRVSGMLRSGSPGLPASHWRGRAGAEQGMRRDSEKDGALRE
jgi:hypothetical protein